MGFLDVGESRSGSLAILQRSFEIESAEKLTLPFSGLWLRRQGTSSTKKI